MAVYNVIFGSTADVQREPVGNAVYATVRNSTATSGSTTATTARAGQEFSASTYSIGQYFAVFDTSTIPSGTGPASLSLNCTVAATAGDNLEVREVTATTNKIAGDSLASFPLYSSLAVPTTTLRKVFSFSDITALSRSSSLKLLVHSQNERLNVAPTVVNVATFNTADQTGTTFDPILSIAIGGWEFVGVSNEVAVATTAHALVTTGISGTLQAGDLLVACITSRIASTTSITLPTGGEWTLVAEQKNNNTLTTSSALPSGLMAYCVRGASNPNLTFTHPVAPSQAQGRIVAYRNVNTSSPKDTQTSFTTATAITAVSGTGLTTTQIEDLIVAMACGGQEAAWSAFNATDPAGASGATVTTAPTTTWSERADSLVTTGADGSLAIFDAVKLTSGATGNLTATASVSAGHVVIAGAFKIYAPPAGDGVGDADGVGAASATGAAIKSADASTASGTGSASATGTGIKSADASTAAGVGTAAATGSSITILEGAGDADGVGAASAAGTGIKSANASSAAGTGAASATGVALAIAAGTASGVGAASATGIGIAASVGTAAGIGSASAEGSTAGVTSSATGTAAGTGAAAATGTGIKAANASSATGLGTAAATATATAASVGTAAGIGTATATGGGIGSGVGDADGIGAATATGRSTGASAGDADGIGTAAATATATAASAGTATGTGAALALSDPGTTTGDATGQGTSAATGRAITVGIGVAAGVGTASATGARTVAGVGTASGLGTATAVSGEEAGVIAEGVGTAAGVGTAHAVGRRIRERPSGGLGFIFRPGPAVIEGIGYGVLPELEGYAVGTVGRRKTIAGRAKGVIALTGHSICDVGVKGEAYSIARLPLMASATMDAGSAGQAQVNLSICKGAAMGDHDPDEHLIIALMMAA